MNILRAENEWMDSIVDVIAPADSNLSSLVALEEPHADATRPEASSTLPLAANWAVLLHQENFTADTRVLPTIR